MSVEVYALPVVNDVRKCGRCSFHQRGGYIVTNDETKEGLDMLFVGRGCQSSSEMEFFANPDNHRTSDYHNALVDRKCHDQYEQISSRFEVKPGCWYIVDDRQLVRRESSGEEADDCFNILQAGLRFDIGENILMLRAAA